MTEVPGRPSIPGYRILGSVGHGAMGSVWRAIDPAGTPVALKVCDRASRLGDGKRAEMFRRESLAALNVRHDNLVRGLAVGETDDGLPYLVLELVEGETLAQRIRDRGPLPEAEAVSLGRALASALEHAHGLGLLHRDVKPANVMLTPEGTAKLVDLSLVAETGLGETGCGSPGYASPEMIRHGEVGPASDLYALGVTLAAAVLGRPFFQGGTSRDVLRASLRVPLVLPDRAGDAELSQGFRAVVARLGRKDPAERYGSAGEARLDFEALAHGERPLGAYLGLARLRGARRPRGWLLAGAATAVAAAIVGVAIPRGNRGEREPVPPAPPPTPVASAGPPPGDARSEAVLLYLDAHPDDFERGRELLAEALANDLSPATKRRLEEASDALDGRRTARAAALLAEKTAAARELREGGDLDGMERRLKEWPEALRTGPEAAEAGRVAASWRRDALSPGAALLEEAAAELGRTEPLTEAALADARDLLSRIRAHLGRPACPVAQRAPLASAGDALADRVGRMERGVRDAAARSTLADALSGAGPRSPEEIRAVMGGLAGEAGASTGVGKLVTAVASRAREVDGVLAKSLATLANRPWAAILDGRAHVGTLTEPPATWVVFAPAWRLADDGRGAVPDLGDLPAVEPDRERAASWLLFSGWPWAAASWAPQGGDARALLVAVGADTATPPAVRAGAWARVVERSPLVERVPGDPLPPLDAGGDRVLEAWITTLKARAARKATRAPAPGKVPPALAEARDAYLSGDGLRAWTALEEAVAAAPTDTEVAILRSRVLDDLARPFPTIGAARLALEEARRAWDLDPSLPAAVRWTAELSIRIRARWPASSEGLAAATLVACEEAVRLGPADAAVYTHLGEHWLREGRAKDAASMLRRAVTDDPDVSLLLARTEDALGDTRRAIAALDRARTRMGPDFPEWARSMLERLRPR